MRSGPGGIVLACVGCAPAEPPDEPRPAETAVEQTEPITSEDEPIPGPDAITLSISTPAPGTFTSDDVLDVGGMVSGLSDLTVNGEPATVNGDTWTATLTTAPGVVPIDVQGTDANGFVHVRRRSALAGTFEPDLQNTGTAIRMRVNQGAVEPAMSALSELFVAKDVEAMLLEDSRIYEDALLWVDITGVDFGAPSLDVGLAEGAMSLSVSLPDLAMTFFYDGPGSFDGNALVTASAVHVDCQVLLGIEEGEFTVEIPSADVTIDDFYFEVDGTLGIEGIFEDLVATALEGALEGVLLEEAPPLIRSSFESLDLSFSENLLGTDFFITASFSSLVLDDDGMELDVDLRIDSDGPETTDHEAPGWFWQPFDPGELSRDRDLVLAMSDNVLNHMMFEAWQAGLLTDKLHTSDGTLSPAVLSLIGALEGGLVFDALLPPVVVHGETSFELQLGESTIDVSTPGAPLGDHVLLVVGGALPVEVLLDESALSLWVGEPDVTLDASDNDWVMRPEEIERLWLQGLPLDLVTDLASDLVVPLSAEDDEDPLFVGGELRRDDSGTSSIVEFDL